MTSLRKSKRLRVENEDSRAECPSSVNIVDPKDKEYKKKKKRRLTNGKDDDTSHRIKLQLSPFSPTGKFKKNPDTDLHYKGSKPIQGTPKSEDSKSATDSHNSTENSKTSDIAKIRAKNIWYRESWLPAPG